MTEEISGYVQHIIYRNEENGYTVLVLETDDDDVTLTCTAPSVHEGEYLEASGEFFLHPTYGQQFRAAAVRSTIPREKTALRRYLGSGAIRGVGDALAGRILKHFGDDTLRVMEEEPERLAEVKGISPRMAQKIGEQFAENEQMRNAMIFLSQYGISQNLGAKIYRQYQDTLYQVLRENPYQLAEDIRGVGFRIADEIASKVGIRRDSEYRIRSGILYVMNMAQSAGHIYLPKDMLLDYTGRLLGIGPDVIEKYLFDLMIDKKIVVREEPGAEGGEDVRVYTNQGYFLELNTARMLCDLNVHIPEDAGEVGERIRRIEKRDGIELDEDQRRAVIASAGNGLLILTGGPGTGKTTTINMIIRYFHAENLSISLAAPTGRAAKRMTEATGYEASTIHRLLEVSGMSGENGGETGHFERNADNPLESDVIVIDEMSMVDIYLMHALLSAIVPGTRLILVGDRNQLPSVGPGSVLRDMIRSGVFPVITLTRIFRQAQESDIVVNAHRIQAGEPVRLDNRSRDFFFLKRNDVQMIQRVILTLVAKKLPGYVDAKPLDIQVLTPMRRGPLGVETLNPLLQRYLNPPAPSKKEKIFGSTTFRTGDKVMQIRNDYQIGWKILGRRGVIAQEGQGVFNGDIGVVTGIDSESETITVLFEESRTVDYTFAQLDELELAYVTTIHKAQGSEYPAVVIPLLGVPRMLKTRNLLYTAITRARKCVVLVGSEDTFADMAANKTEEKRYTSLAARIREIADADSPAEPEGRG